MNRTHNFTPNIKYENSIDKGFTLKQVLRVSFSDICPTFVPKHCQTLKRISNTKATVQSCLKSTMTYHASPHNAPRKLDQTTSKDIFIWIACKRNENQSERTNEWIKDSTILEKSVPGIIRSPVPPTISFRLTERTQIFIR